MSIATFDDLVAMVKRFAKRADLNDLIPDFVTLAETNIGRELRVNKMLTRAQNATIINEFGLAPTDFLAPKSMRLVDEPDTILRFLSVEQMSDYKATKPTGTLTSYALVGSEFWFLPAPQSPLEAELIYYAQIPALSASNQTNWLLTANPDVYLWGTLMQAADFLEDDNQLQKYASRFKDAILAIEAADKRDSQAANVTPSPSTGPVA